MTMQSGTPSDRSGDGPAERPGLSSGSPSSGTPTSGTSGGPKGSASMPGPAGSGGRHADSPSTGAGDWTHPDEMRRSEFGAFLDDLSELARGGHGPGELRSEIERRVSHARERMSDALHQGRELTVRARDQMNRGIEYSRDAVTERPLSSVTIAAVGGLIVGLLLSRRH